MKLVFKKFSTMRKVFPGVCLKNLAVYRHQIAMEMETKLVNIYQQFALKLEMWSPKKMNQVFEINKEN